MADGAENNWTLHRQLFSSFVPILDFIHGLSYVFAAAMAGRGFREGWAVYERWIQWVWSGNVQQALVELAARQAELGEPTATEPSASPRAVVARALNYLTNNKERMKYADYRRQGLPITSSYVESAVKQINRRVKGTEKFWNEAAPKNFCNSRRPPERRRHHDRILATSRNYRVWAKSLPPSEVAQSTYRTRRAVVAYDWARMFRRSD